jgi:hypothetical protein
MRRGPAGIDRSSAQWNARGMALCECGRPLSASGELCARCDALRTLGLERGASPIEIRDTYRDLVKVWHPDRFSNDGKLRSRAEEKLKEVNAAFQRLNSSAVTTPSRAASATNKPYWTSRTSTRTYQWYSTPARESPRRNASAQEPPRNDAPASGVHQAARPHSYGNARGQSPAPEASRPIHADFQHLNSAADEPPAPDASAKKKPEEKVEAQKLYDASQRTPQPSSAFAKETFRSHASAQEPPRTDATASSFLHASRPQSRGNARTQSPALEANDPIYRGAPIPSFSLRRISYLLVLALFVAFTRMWVDADQNPKTAQDEIMNQYYEAAARKNVFSQPTAQDVIMNLYYEVESRANSLSQLESAPTIAEDSPFVSSPSPASPKQDLPLSQKRSSGTAASAPPQSNCPVSGSAISATAPFHPLPRAGQQGQPSWRLLDRSDAGCWSSRATSAWKPGARR